MTDLIFCMLNTATTKNMEIFIDSTFRKNGTKNKTSQMHIPSGPLILKSFFNKIPLANYTNML